MLSACVVTHLSVPLVKLWQNMSERMTCLSLDCCGYFSWGGGGLGAFCKVSLTKSCPSRFVACDRSLHHPSFDLLLSPSRHLCSGWRALHSQGNSLCVTTEPSLQSDPQRETQMDVFIFLTRTCTVSQSSSWTGTGAVSPLAPPVTIDRCAV